MKKIFLLLVLFAMIGPGCKKQLETKVYSVLTPDNFYKSEADANAALITLYVPFSSYWGNPDPGNNTWYAALYNADIKSYLSKSLISTDELYNEGSGANEHTLHGIAKRTLLFIQVIGHECAERLHADIDTGIEDP